jgi:hypothetical protein
MSYKPQKQADFYSFVSYLKKTDANVPSASKAKKFN